MTVFPNVFRKKSRRKSNQDEHSSLSSTSYSTNELMASGQSDGIPTKITQKSENVTTVEAFVHLMNNYTNVGDLESFFVPEAVFVPEDHSPIPIHNFAILMDHIFKAFPDFSFPHESVKDDRPDTVMVERLRVCGTHTGIAYTPRPGKLPEIPTSGKHVVLDEERWFIELEGGKIRSLAVVSLGTFSGPIGVYEKLAQILAEDPTKQENSQQKLAQILTEDPTRQESSQRDASNSC